jgi:TolB-like protein/Tfp pilus assembly protein PilF
MVATVEAEEPAAAEPLPRGPGPEAETPARRVFRYWSPIAALVLLAAGLGTLRWQHPGGGPPAANERLMLAVLPFENLTGDASQEYLTDGLTEEMIGQLGRLDPQRFGVIARTSAMHYKHTGERVDQIGRELGVQYVLEGSVRRESDEIRVSAQLIRVKDETHTWARQYNRQLTNLLALQDEIANEISDEIQLTVGEGRSGPPVARASSLRRQSPAYDLYLKGLYFWNKRTVPDFRQAIVYFQQAIAKDPKYAPSYTGLANTYAMIDGYSMDTGTGYMVQARIAALQALEIDPSLPEAHTALAVILNHHDWDWKTAEREFLRAIELNPNYATAHHWYAEHLGFVGRFDEAFRESERARQLDPLSLIIAADNGVLLLFSRQYDRAIEKFRSVLELDPGFPRAGMITSAYLEKGMFSEVLGTAEADASKNPEAPWDWVNLADAYGRAGQAGKAQRALDRLLALNRLHPIDPGAIAKPYLALGNKDEAMAWLEKAYSQHSETILVLKVDPHFDPLRGDPRFQELMRRVKLSP